ncbi:hypothetical protein [Polaribacter vadi]|uniref:hypothetical protein n=1 Tax=Polaribacter vadi TaxID=1774273 RepID=UPI0030ECADBD
MTESCLEINKISESLVPTQFEVDKIEEIIFKLISSYEVDFCITDSKLFDNFNQISLQRINKSEINKLESFEFILLFSPKTKGVKQFLLLFIQILDKL